MPTIPAFGPWDEKTHLGDKQEKTIQRAQLSETTPQSVDPTAQTAIFFGSGKKPYQTSLSSCTCSDFTRRKLPCKHIYRLAMELGIIDLPYKSGESKVERLDRQISLEDAVTVIETLSDDAQHRLSELLGATCDRIDNRFTPHLVTEPSIIEEFRACPLLEERPAVSLILSRLGRNDMNDLIAQIGVENPPKKNSSTAFLFQWIQDNVPNVSEYLPPYAAFSFIINFDRVQRSAYQYLLRKYENDVSTLDGEHAVVVPHGSNPPGFSIIVSTDGITRHTDGNPNAFYFPDDAITALLTKYGHNRCLNGFIPVQEK